VAIKTLLFDDNQHIRDAVAMLIATDLRFEFCGAYDKADYAAELVSIHHPDVVIMDIDMPVVNGIDAVRVLHKTYPELPIIMLTVFDDVDRIFGSLQNGALGYMLKSTPPNKLLDAIIDVYQGGAPMSPAIARKVMTHFQKDTSPSVDYALTSREMEVLSLLVDGLPYKLIGDRLGIGIETVRTHIKKIYGKLHVQTMTEAVSKALRENIVIKPNN